MNDKIKLVHVIAGLTGGGRERRMVELVKGLNSNEFYEQYVILLNKAIDYPDIYKTDAKIIVIDYPSKLETTKVIFRTLKTLRPSILHLWTEIHYVLILISVLKPFLSYRLIVGFLADGNPVRKLLSRFANRLAFTMADRIVSNSKAGGIAKNAPQNKADVIYNAYKSIKKTNAKVIYMSPQGKTLNQQMVQDLAKEENIILLCGHYEGIDQRVIDEIVDEEISIGDYVLTGGELPAMVLIDSVSRYVEGVLKEDSVQEESFTDGLLEYPQYTRPEVFLGKRVPEVLLSGHHENIKKWRRNQSIINTYLKRPDLLREIKLSDKEQKMLSEYKNLKEGGSK